MARTNPTSIDRRDYLRLAGGLAAGATVGIAGCAEEVPGGSDGDGTGGDGTADGADAGSATGLLSTAVSDDPGDIGDFESCIVALDGVWVGPRVDGEGDGGGDEEDGEGSETDESDDADGAETEGDDEGGPPADAPAGNASSEDGASGSQEENETQSDGADDDPDEDDPDGDPEGSGGDDEEGEGGDGEEGEGEGDEDDGGSGEGEADDGSGADDGDGRTYYQFDEPQEADLTELQGDAQQLVGEHELPVGTYRFLQLDVAGVRGTLTDGSEADVTTPGNAPLKFNQSFDVREGYRTTFLADFTPVRRGDGSYLFRPVASETEVSYEAVEGGDGSEEATGGESGDDGGDETEGDAPDGDHSDDGNATDPGSNETASSGNETTA